MEITTKNLFELNDGEEYDKCCGKLFLTTKRNIAIHCTLCESKYRNFLNFVNHINEYHSANSDEEDRYEYLNNECDVSSFDEKEVPITLLQMRSQIKTEYIKNPNVVHEYVNSNIEINKNNHDKWQFETPTNKYGKIGVIPSKNGPYKCSDCDLRFPMNFMLKEHLKEHETDRKFRCKVCKVLFKKGYLLAAHMRRHATIKNFQCDECDKSFITQSELRYHKRKHKGEKLFQCEDCGKTFMHSSTLGLHRKCSHLNQADYSCPLCEKSYFTSRHLRDHMSNHTNECSYKCNHCEKAFKQQGALTRHRRQHKSQEEAENIKTNKLEK